MLSICKNHIGCKNYHRFPLSILIKIFSQSLEGWQQVQVTEFFRKIRIYREPPVAHVPSVGQNPLQVTILIPCKGQARAQMELCYYSAATQRCVCTKAPRSGEKSWALAKDIFSGIQSQEKVKGEVLSSLPQHQGDAV